MYKSIYCHRKQDVYENNQIDRVVSCEIHVRHDSTVEVVVKD